MASFVEFSSFLICLAAVIAAVLFLICLAAKIHRAAIAGIILIFLCFGFLRFDAAWRATQDNDLAKFNGKTGEITGQIINDPVFGESNQQINLQPNGLSGKILVLANRYPEFRYGDKIKFTAKLEEPQAFNGFDYKNYLAKDGIYAMARFSDIELISENNGNPIYAGLFWIKHNLKQGIGQSLPAPQNGLLTAILLGDQSGLSSCSAGDLEIDSDCTKLKEKLNIAGLRHLAAVSGTHITIMAGIIAPFLVWLGWWRQKALWATLAFVWVFVAMIGLPASAVRAGIMGSLMILAKIIGRPSDILRLIIIAAAFMVLQNPLVLRFDVGFQLSFLAVLGMVCFAKPIEIKLKFIPKNPEFLRPALAITLAAQIFTLPLLIYNFGYVSFYAPLTNLLVEPFVEFITVYGFILAIFGAISTVLGWLLFFPIWFLLSCLIWVTEFFSSLPLARLNLETNFFWLALAYTILGIAAHRIKENEKLDFS